MAIIPYVKWSKKRVATGWCLVGTVAREGLVDIHGVIIITWQVFFWSLASETNSSHLQKNGRPQKERNVFQPPFLKCELLVSRVSKQKRHWVKCVFNATHPWRCIRAFYISQITCDVCSFFLKQFVCVTYSLQISHGLAEHYMFFKFGSFPENPEEKLHLQNLTCETPQKMNDFFSMFIGVPNFMLVWKISGEPSR